MIFLNCILCLTIIAIVLFAFLTYNHNRNDSRLLLTVTDLNIGTKSERDFILKLLKFGIPSGAIWHNLYLKKNSKKYSQIDIVVATKVGIIVIEVKDFSGWIFGNGYHQFWKQILAYGQSRHSFYNPIMQNINHIKTIKQQSNVFDNIPFYSVIVFYGECDLKEISFIPQNTYIATSNAALNVINDILLNNTDVKYKNKLEIVRIFKNGINNSKIEGIENQHIVNINDEIGKHRIFY